jgi:hypothetical protein
MASSNNVPNMEDRFSALNTEVNTQRVMFDVAALPTGTLLRVDDRLSDEDDFGENLSRQLFGDPTSSPVNEEAQVTNEQPEVTVESTQHTSINSNEETTEADRLLESLGDGREEVAASLLDFAAAQPEKRRYRFSYAKKYFFASRANCAFDEGGIACRSRYCPVRQYNKDKPDKFRVDFFILAGSKTYLIYHIDVYQGKNSANIGIYPPAANLPTTMKAVVNAIVKSDLKNGSNDVNGYRVVSLDNRYQCPQLAFLLWHR